MTFRIITGDCIEAMQEMDESSVDAIVTDPPYGLEFMGKEWDRLGPVERQAEDGGGDRRAVVDAEAWMYGGEPNAYSRARVRWQHGSAGPAAMQAWHQAWATEALRVLKPGAHLLSFGGTRTYHRLTCALEDAGFEIRDCLAWLYGSGFPKSLNIGGGFGTALKPAFEPIVLARKPLSERNVASNVQRWGTGALNIDGCRIEGHISEMQGRSGKSSPNQILGEGIGYDGMWEPPTSGRWPANVILDEQAAEMLDQQTGELHSQSPETRNRGRKPGWSPSGTERPWLDKSNPNGGDSGGASRFFYVPKADREERNRGTDTYGETLEPRQRDQARSLEQSSSHQKNGGLGNPYNRGVRPIVNHHPTVKPVELMQWLCRMVTPPHGLVLDPFLGSGTTGIAALREGFEFVGIERERDYVEIARARIIGDAPLFNVEALDG